MGVLAVGGVDALSRVTSSTTANAAMATASTPADTTIHWGLVSRVRGRRVRAPHRRQTESPAGSAEPQRVQ